MLRDSVVPDDDGARLPPDAGLEVSTVGKVVVEELEQGVRLFLLEADDLSGDCMFVSDGFLSIGMEECLHWGLT